jgi:hypothetical protein
VSDYFTRLAERALGATSLPRPAVPSPFEPTSHAGFEEIELEASAPGMTMSQVQKESSPGVERAPVTVDVDSGADQPSSVPGQQVFELAPSPGKAMPPSRQPAAEAPAPVTAERVLIYEHHRDIIEHQNVVVELLPAAPTPGQAVVSPSQPRQIEARPFTQSAASTNSPEAHALDHDAPVPAVVQVTIGRVDVRAVTPPTSPERSRPPRPLRPSLADYLSGRGGRT